MTGNRIIMTLGTGIVLGFGIACFILQSRYPPVEIQLQQTLKYLRAPDHDSQEGEGGLHSRKAFENAPRHNLTASHHSSDKQDQAGDNVQAPRVAKGVRVLCWIMTSPSNYEKKAIHVKKTWGKRCNKLIFMSSKSDKNLGAVGLPVEEGRDWLWAKTKEAFKYVWEHHRDEADWFLKADDDTFVILENLRNMLSDFDANYPIYFGLLFKPFVKQGYMSGGAGYVLSKEAMRRFIEQALPDRNKCSQSHDGPEDVEMGRCLQAVGVKAGDCRDNLGRYRFLEFSPGRQVLPSYIDDKKQSWYWEWIYYPQSHGFAGISDTAISFHYVPPDQMYNMEYLIYQLRVPGASHNPHWTNELEGNKDPTDEASGTSKTVKTVQSQHSISLDTFLAAD